MFTNQQINLETLPSIDDVDFKPISKQYLKIIVINRVFLYLLIMAGLFFAKFMVKEDNFHSLFWYAFALAVIFFILNLITALMAFKKRKYAIREQDVIYSQGLLVSSMATVPISRVQHIEISRSWLARKLNLATLKIFTAGESGIDLKIDGLDYSEAQKINDFLSKKVNGPD
ncbi:PH domain-containing protein [Gelidibacter mesophilus]|uniref:PH domain-containing protein n=1 Tax=Gelidibacter mesophilus TaxID=169050 RepID=UPI000557C7E9|nr:PH domain-containing protein [Gelidibacter mesophilus]